MARGWETGVGGWVGGNEQAEKRRRAERRRAHRRARVRVASWGGAWSVQVAGCRRRHSARVFADGLRLRRKQRWPSCALGLLGAPPPRPAPGRPSSPFDLVPAVPRSGRKKRVCGRLRAGAASRAGCAGVAARAAASSGRAPTRPASAPPPCAVAQPQGGVPGRVGAARQLAARGWGWGARAQVGKGRRESSHGSQPPAARQPAPQRSGTAVPSCAKHRRASRGCAKRRRASRFVPCGWLGKEGGRGLPVTFRHGCAGQLVC